jgi:hypothetical protein
MPVWPKAQRSSDSRLMNLILTKTWREIIQARSLLTAFVLMLGAGDARLRSLYRGLAWFASCAERWERGQDLWRFG